MARDSRLKTHVQMLGPNASASAEMPGSRVQISVVFFASLVDLVGSRRLSLDVVDGATLDEILKQLESSYPGLKDYRSLLLTAVNEEYAEGSHGVSDGDEIAIFPPVSGGEATRDSLKVRSAHEFYEITHAPIDAGKISRELLCDADGAICVFEGVVRNESKGKATRYLSYEAYEGMALKKLEEIGQLVRNMWDIDSIGIVHRLGRLEIGEASVAVIVTSPHRRAAFDACHYAIDRLKKIVPIWKKEHFEDGEVWVEGQS